MTSQTDKGAELERTLTSRQLSMIVIGGAIGTGLFLGSGDAIGRAGPAVILAFLLGALLALALAYALGEMSTARPVAGGFGTLTHRYLGPTAGFTHRWAYWVAQVINIGSEATAILIYLQYWWPGLPGWVPIVAATAVVLGLNLFPVRVFGESEYWLTAVKITTIVAFVGIGLLVVVFGLPSQPSPGLEYWTEPLGFAPNGLSGVWLAMVTVVFSYMGTEALSMTAAESRRPDRDIPRATRRTVFRLALFYLLTIAVIISLQPADQADADSGLTESPFVSALGAVGLPAAATIINLVVLVAALSAMNTNLYVASRMLFGMARSGHAPGLLGGLHRGRPWPALAASSAGLLLAAGMSVLAPADAFALLISLSLFNALASWIFIFGTHLAYRRVEGRDIRDGPAIRLRAPTVTAILAIVVLGAIMVTMLFVDEFQLAPIAGGVFLAGMASAYAFVRRRRRS